MPWACRWKHGPPQAEIYIHPALNSAGFRPGGLKRLEMLLVPNVVGLAAHGVFMGQSLEDPLGYLYLGITMCIHVH
jgi:hypothetical protein